MDPIACIRGLCSFRLISAAVITRNAVLSYGISFALQIETIYLSFSVHNRDVLLLLCACREDPPFQAVIVDLQGLDHASALHLVQSIRKEPNVRSIPVLALSIPPSTETQKELLEAGFSQIVHKPLRCTTLVAGLLQALGVQMTSASRRANTNAKMLSGKRILVVGYLEPSVSFGFGCWLEVKLSSSYHAVLLKLFLVTNKDCSKNSRYRSELLRVVGGCLPMSIHLPSSFFNACLKYLAALILMWFLFSFSSHLFVFLHFHSCF